VILPFPGEDRRESVIPRLPRRARLLLFALAVAARLAAVAATGFHTVGFGDARAYLGAATVLARTGQYPLRTDAFFFRPPAYPAFLAAATLGHPDRIPLAKVANALLGGVSPVLLAAISIRIFRNRALALWTGTAAAIHPAFLLVCSDIQTEALFLLFLLSSGYVLLAATDRPSSNLALAAGALLGLAALTRASALGLAPLLAAPILDRRFPWRLRAHLAAAGLAGFCLMVAPWTLRNALVFGRLIPVSDMGGFTFYDGNSDWTRRFYRLRSREEYDRWVAALERDKQQQIAALSKVDPAAAARPSEYFGRLALRQSLADPGAALALDVRKALDWLRPYPSRWFWPPLIVVSVAILYILLFILAGFGLAIAPRPGVSKFLLVFLAVTMAIHVASLVVWRYRVPYWDPVLLLYAPAGAWKLFGDRIP
jgi:dolichyl-phosphate-mannose-protein mannosyltransferase